MTKAACCGLVNHILAAIHNDGQADVTRLSLSRALQQRDQLNPNAAGVCPQMHDQHAGSALLRP